MRANDGLLAFFCFLDFGRPVMTDPELVLIGIPLLRRWKVKASDVPPYGTCQLTCAVVGSAHSKVR
jgi:hypothetical protein